MDLGTNILDTEEVKEGKEGDKQWGESLDNPTLQAMADAGVFYGRSKSKTHPSMRSYIYATRNNIEIINLVKTQKALDEAGDFLARIASGGGNILFVGTRPASRDAVEKIAKKHNYPFVINRWLGGTMTNYKVISGRIKYMLKRRKQIETGELEKYTKKERLKMRKEYERLEELMGGLERLKGLPEAVVVVNIDEHDIAVREARKLNIPIVAIVGTASDVELVQYPIPANDTAKASIDYIFDQLDSAIEEGKKQKSTKRESEESKQKSEENKKEEKE